MHFRILSWNSIARGAPIPRPAQHGRPEWEGSGSQRGQETTIPLVFPQWTRPATPLDSVVTTWNDNSKYPGSFVEFSSERRGPFHPETARPGSLSVLLFPRFFAAALSRQSFFYALTFAGLQVERVTFYFFYDVLGLYLPLKAAKSVLKGFTLLKPNFSQSDYTPLLVLTGPLSYGKPCRLSQVECAEFFVRGGAVLPKTMAQLGQQPSRVCVYTRAHTDACSKSGTLEPKVVKPAFGAAQDQCQRASTGSPDLEVHAHRQLQSSRSIGSIQLHKARRLLIICGIVSPTRVLAILNKLPRGVIKANT